MKTYKDLLEHQKNLFNKIEEFFLSNKTIQRKDFIKVLAILINKFKYHTLKEKGKPSTVSKEKLKK